MDSSMSSTVDFDNTDPRQYITIYEIKNTEKQKIWFYRESDKKGNQTRKILDVSSEIQIEFEKDKIALNRNFKGNITIEGKIISKDGGEDPVEVFPYSRIGEEKKGVGIPTRPPYEIATVFTNLIIECLRVVKDTEIVVDDGLVDTGDKIELSTFMEDAAIGEIQNISNSVGVILEYINYFKTSGEQAEDAFLGVIKLDYIALDKIEENLKGHKEKIDKYLENPSGYFLINPSSALPENLVLKNLYFPAREEISKLIQLRGTEIEALLDERFYRSLSLKVEHSADKDKIIKKLSNIASKTIYRDLNYATINLKKERASEGDILYIYVALEETQRRKNSDKGGTKQIILPIGTYELRNTKWQVNISDSFFLVDRINEPDNQTVDNVSPSNFKGAPGVSLLLTYRRDGGEKNSFINFIEPSIGINVSYLDFSTSDDVEIGTGLLVGFFNKKIFVTGGINLNQTGNSDESPMYWGVGFSFANLVGKLLNKD
ncbi:hypothetical protein [Winogradskyella sp.]|uniref:hypothetical protein n=1 Tax=Winogradskyella sp. TaxID=1883156 RepID=UPI00262A8683|nr:hypothetical protein [Winogradskyella sp.]